MTSALKFTPKNELMIAVFYAGESRRPNIAQVEDPSKVSYRGRNRRPERPGLEVQILFFESKNCKIAM